MNSVLLAKFLGFYIIIVSAVFVLRYESFVKYAEKFAEDISLRFSVALVELAAGLAIVLTHSVYEMSYRGVVTVLGWMMLVEAIFHLAATEDQERRLISVVDKRAYWRFFGVLSLLLGFYLATLGFTTF